MVKVKICGITNLEDGIAAVDAGADLLGFVCYARSPRYVAPETIRTVIAGVRAHRARVAPQPVGSAPSRIPRFVGVFVNAPPLEIRRVMDETGLEFAQLHGDEPVDDLLAVRGRGYKALRPQSLAAARKDAALYAGGLVHRGPHLLLDAYVADAYGGTGQRTDWDWAAVVAGETHHLLLAGGLTVDNVGEAIQKVRPWGVDTSSGVEASPGKKHHDLLRRFIAAAKHA